MKLKTRVKIPRTKPTTFVPLAGGYTPAEEKAMQERKVALIEHQEALLKGSNEYLRLIEHDIREQVDAIKALSNVLQVLVTQAVLAKRGRPAKVPQEGPQEPVVATPAIAPVPEHTPTFVEASKALRPVLEKANAPAPTVDELRAPTLDELRTAFLDYIARNGRDAGIKQLAEFGIAKLGELPAEKYPAFKSRLG